MRPAVVSMTACFPLNCSSVSGVVKSGGGAGAGLPGFDCPAAGAALRTPINRKEGTIPIR